LARSNLWLDGDDPLSKQEDRVANHATTITVALSGDDVHDGGKNLSSAPRDYILIEGR
jgi:hypothetical protein